MAGRIEKILQAMKANASGVSFAEAIRVCEHFFGEVRINGSHHIFKTPWPGDPRINLQKDKSGKAKAYQVKQIMLCIEQLNSLEKKEE